MQNAVIWLYFLLIFVPVLALVGRKALDLRDLSDFFRGTETLMEKKELQKNSSDLVNKWITIGSFRIELSKIIIQVFLQFMSVGPETLSLHESDSPRF